MLIGYAIADMTRAVSAAPSLLTLTLTLAPAPPAAAAEVKLDGYAEWREGDCLVVDGQRVRMAAGGQFHAREKARTFAEIPLGYEVKGAGLRQPDGSVSARHLDVRPNNVALFENMIRDATAEAEARYRKFGQIFEESGGRMKTVGRLEVDGPCVERVRGIVTQLLPPYVDPAKVHVYVVDNKDWNGFAMGNYAVFVYRGLLHDLDDDELAIVLGHELVHATHEHTRRQIKKEMWIQLAAAGAAGAASSINSKGKRTVAEVVTQLAAVAWSNGYGRDLEDQADRVGLRYAYEAGYDVRKGPVLWDRFADKYGRGNAVVNFFFGNHSRSTARAASLRQELAMNYRDGPRTAGSVPKRPVPVMVSAPAHPAAAATAGLALAAPARGASDRRDIKLGMTPAEVRTLLGEPQEEVVFDFRTRWTFPDCTVIFDDGRVVDVKF